MINLWRIFLPLATLFSRLPLLDASYNLPANKRMVSNVINQKTRACLLLLLLMTTSQAVHAASYSLPADIGSGAFSSCSGSGPAYSCGDITLNDNDTVSLTSDVTLNMTGSKFEIKKDVTISDNGNTFIVNAKDVTIEENSVIDATINATDKVDIKKDVTINGDISAKDVDLEDDVTVNGNIVATDKVDIKKDVTINGDISAKDVKLEKDVTVNGSVFASDSLDLKKDVVITGDCPPWNYSECLGMNLPAIDHFVINVGAGAANACSPYPITITAEDSSNATITDYDGTVIITTSTSNGNFAAGSPAPTNNLNPNPDNDDNGSVGYSFDGADNGVIALTLFNPHIESLTITVNDTSESITSTSSTIAFAEAGFSIVDIDSMAVSDVPVAGRGHAFRITALRLDPVNGCGTATGYSGAKDLKLWRSKNAADTSAIDPTLAGYSLPDAESGSTSSVTFSSGIADVNLATTDIGKYVINVADRTGLFTAADISGSSTEQTIRPFGIGVTNIVGLIANPNPLVATSVDPIFAVAGGNFSATVSAVLWDASDDTNNDGLLDTGTFAGNTVAPGYDWNTPWVISGYEPNLGTVGILNNADFNSGGFTSGAQTVTTLSYDEVGSFTFQATATNFLNTPGVNPPAESIVVGRFIPAGFSVSANTDGVLGEACTSFTYIGQPFGYETTPSNQAPTFTVTAVNVGLQPTGNYREAWAKLDGNSVTATASQDSVNSLLVSYTPAEAMTAVKANDNSGQVNYTFGADIFRYGPEPPTTFAKYSNSQVAPFVAAPNLTITNVDDGEVSQPGGVNVTEAVAFLAGNSVSLRFGRLAMSNVHGSELNALVMPVVTEFWTGFSFQKNTLDTCTVIDASDLNSVGNPVGLSVPAVVNPIASAGDVDYSYPAPAGGATGYVDTATDLGSAAHPWLRYDWLANGEFDDDPSARATFGIFAGNPVQIYIQQVYP